MLLAFQLNRSLGKHYASMPCKSTCIHSLQLQLLIHGRRSYLHYVSSLLTVAVQLTSNGMCKNKVSRIAYSYNDWLYMLTSYITIELYEFSTSIYPVLTYGDIHLTILYSYIYFHHISDCLVFNQVIPLKMFYCMLVIPGVKLLMLPSLLWLGFWTWLRPLTVLIMIFFQTSWLIMMLWVVIMLSLRAFCVVTSKQSSLMIPVCLGFC